MRLVNEREKDGNNKMRKEKGREKEKERVCVCERGIESIEKWKNKDDRKVNENGREK